MKTSSVKTQYLIGTCLGCKKCLYCGVELSMRKRTCSCDKNIKPSKGNRNDKVKVAFPRVSSPDLQSERLKFIQEKVAKFGYSLDLNATFNFSLCSTCNSSFQRLKTNSKSTNTSNLSSEKTLVIDSSEDDLENSDVDVSDEIGQDISFNLVIKPVKGSALPSKCVEIKEVACLDDVLADIHHHTIKLTGDGKIIHSDYVVTFKSEKAVGIGARLDDIQDYKKFLLDYKKLSEAKKNMTIIVSIKKKEKQKQQKNSDSEESESEDTKSHKRKTKIPKLEGFSEILQQEGRIIRDLREKYKCKNHDACFVDDRRHLKLTAMHLQCWAKEIIRGTTDDTQMPNTPIFSQSSSTKENSPPPPTLPNSSFNSSNLNTFPMSFNPSNSNTMVPFLFMPFMQNSNNNNSGLSLTEQQIPSLEEFFAGLDGEFAQFKSVFENERITVDQIHDLTDIEFSQLGIIKIGWRKTLKAAAQRYKK